jgi:hypothetical protein
LAGGTALAAAALPLRRVSWPYLRLISIVCLAIVVLAGAVVLRGGLGTSSQAPQLITLATAAAAGVIWLLVNAAQRRRVNDLQRTFAIALGIAALATTVLLIGFRNRGNGAIGGGAVAGHSWMNAASLVLGAALLGTVTAGMLLGHRYLTDTGMTIAPLRRLSMVHSGAVAMRAAWLVVAGWPMLAADFVPAGGATWFWMMVTLRFGVGVVATAAFAWMIHDCVRRRATQSATALFYLSMVFVYAGELAGQSLMRGEGLPL